MLCTAGKVKRVFSTTIFHSASIGKFLPVKKLYLKRIFNNPFLKIAGIILNLHIMASNKVLVTGSNGQLGNELKELSSAYLQFKFVFFGREKLPLNDQSAVEKVFREYEPAFLINCAAYTAVDKAESEKEQAEEINGRAVGSLAATCKSFGTKLIHISTDYVFNGKATSPLKEDDAVDPVNAYG